MNLPSPQLTGRGAGIADVTLGSLRLSASATVTRRTRRGSESP